MFHRQKASSLFLVLIIISLIQVPLSRSYSEYGYDKTHEIDKIGFVEQVTDGDTFRLTDGQVVRLADIDVPESYETGYSDSTEAPIGMATW